MEGDSVTLNTDVQVQRDDQILWVYGPQDSRIAEIHRQNIYVHYSEMFRDRLQMNSQTGSLTIRNINKTHAGLYKLQIIRSSGTKRNNFTIYIYAPLPVPVISRDSSQCSSPESSNCSLVCSAVNVSHATLSWYKGNSLLSSISVSDLSISLSLPLEVEYQDKNTYSCVLNNPISNQTQYLDIRGLCHTCAAVEQNSRFLVATALIALVLVVIAAGFICLKKCKQPGKIKTDDEEMHYAETTFSTQLQSTEVVAEEHTLY
ncbi:T-lymphocyte surface antigen Ly-9-like [Ctenopharyngodon idella]|uniref:T-lymphocyte surface antigen Ly-9-like n=1 Tax=Ctenopharyngodon idella TaxID=7959 RepID=UPI0022310976|nr:T-lymphocyte surface antigen Ly-9-like [Ctenopharyngodon idella]